MSFNFFLLIFTIIIFPIFSVTQGSNEIGRSLNFHSSATKRNENRLIQTLTPYRASIKKWVKNLLSDVSPSPVWPRAEYITCDVCQMIHPIIMEMLADGSTSEEIILGITNFCIKLEIEAPDVCEGSVRSYGTIRIAPLGDEAKFGKFIDKAPILYIIVNKPDLSMNDLCGILNPGCTPVNENLTNWDIFLDDHKPPVQTLPVLPEDLATIKILQLTDVHVDVDYVIGSNADCGKPLCCRDGVPEFDNMTAGLYGHPECGLPTLAYDLMLEHAATVHGEIKYVFLTGDYVHNGVWFYSPEENGKNIRHVTEKLVATFPNTPIYPLVGNHEPDVVNMYPPEELWDEFDLSWLYREVSRPFGKWLGPEQLVTFEHGGFYTVKPEAGLRLVILNTNICYLNNFWLAFDTSDPTGQLQWFADTMLQAENDGDTVLILGHISPGSTDCWPVWSEKFDQIVNRFENIIRGQFYGHEHSESFAISFEPGTDRPLATGSHYLGPSGVPSGSSSAYKIYTVDGARGLDSTFEIVDHETWILNTTQSNEVNAPVFEKVYSAKDDYGLDSLRGDQLYNFVLRMLNDDALFLKYQTNYVKGFTSRGLRCEPSAEDYESCKMGLLCQCVTAYSGDLSHCDRLEEIRNETSSTKL